MPTDWNSYETWLEAPMLWLFGAIAVLGVYALKRPMSRRIMLRAGFVAVPVALIGCAGVLQVFRLVPAVEAWRVSQALVAGGVVALGWFVTFVVQEYRREEDRRQRIEDIVWALRYEIYAAVEMLDRDAISADASEVQNEIMLGGEGKNLSSTDRSNVTQIPAGAAAPEPYVPFAATPSPPTIYQAVSGDITLLSDEDVLSNVARFYAAYSDLTVMVADVRSDGFAALSRSRRVRAHESLTRARRATFYWALRALVDIGKSLGFKRPGAIPLSYKNKDIWQQIPEIATLRTPALMDDRS